MFLSLGFTTRGFSRSQIPNYTPNVVDPHHYLKSHQIIEINSQLEIIRNKADIWGAVYLVKDLGDETIEDQAAKAFRKWKLGAIKKDNGLLLVLAMNNRKSRFEVGYGLEGDLPDIIAREKKMGNTKYLLLKFRLKSHRNLFRLKNLLGLRVCSGAAI